MSFHTHTLADTHAHAHIHTHAHTYMHARTHAYTHSIVLASLLRSEEMKGEGKPPPILCPSQLYISNRYSNPTAKGSVIYPPPSSPQQRLNKLSGKIAVNENQKNTQGQQPGFHPTVKAVQLQTQMLSLLQIHVVLVVNSNTSRIYLVKLRTCSMWDSSCH